METTSYMKLKWKTRFEKAWRVCTDVASAAWEFSQEHKEIFVFLSPFAAKAVKSLVDGHQKHTQDTRIWDPELGMFWKIRRPMTSYEQRQYMIRARNGEDRGDILAALKLLK